MALAVHSFPAQAPTGAPVVLLHGFTSSSAEDYLATGWPEALNAAGRSAHFIDLPGHGDSPAIAGAAEVGTSQVVAAILEAAEKATSGAEFDVVGYSLGGRLAWELPSASPLVRRVVLGGVSPFEPFSMVDAAELAAVLGGDAPTNPLVGMMAGMISAPGRDTPSLARLIEGLASQPFDPAAGGPQGPTLFVAGDADQMTQGIEGLVEALPQASLIRVPGDHRGALDSAEFRAAALAFLAE